MPVLNDSPKALRPYQFHGVNLDARPGRDQAAGDCPFCGKEGKFFVRVDNGLWQCRVCLSGSEKGGGNVYTFLRELHKQGTGGKAQDLAGDRRLKSVETLEQWGVKQSVITGEWMVPGYTPDGKLAQLYRYTKDNSTGRMVLMATQELPHQMFGMHLFNPKGKDVYLCEGPWDGMALWEALRMVKSNGAGGLTQTGNPAVSLGEGCSVVAVPGCNVFADQWRNAFKGKRVHLMYDNDYPRKHPKTGAPIPPTGYAAMKRVAGILAAAEEPPESIHYLCWGEEGWTRNYNNGFDVRDFLSATPSPKEVPAQVGRLLGMVKPIPEDWVKGRTAAAKAKGGTEIELIPCSSWKDVTTAFRKAMKWTEGLDRALSLMLACVVSTKSLGDQLWLKVMSPPSTGKTTLCEAISACRKYIYPKDTLTGLFSGMQTDADGTEDLSMAKSLNGKTLIIKDADTVLQNPALPQILSEFRAFYDRSVRTQYKNKMSKDHEGLSTTVIICGTNALRALDASELGARFLDCVIMDGFDDDLEDEILRRVIGRSRRNIALESNGKAESQHDPDTVKVMQLTGGYVAWLRDNAQQLLGKLSIPEWADDRCITLGKFVAFMRARPSKKQDEAPAEREFAARLVSQIHRLMCCTAVVLGKGEVDEEVMRRVNRTAIDTSRGKVADICKVLYEAGEKGVEVRTISLALNEPEDKLRVLLKFMKQIGCAEVFTNRITTGLAGKPRWKLTNKVQRLYGEVML